MVQIAYDTPVVFIRRGYLGKFRSSLFCAIHVDIWSYHLVSRFI